MENRRICQLSFMLSDITGISQEEAESLILECPIGECIIRNNPAVIYEQQTENMEIIAQELTDKGIEIARLITMDSIVEAMRHLMEKEENEYAQGSLGTYRKKAHKEVVHEKQHEQRSRILKQKRENLKNVRRINHVNKHAR